MPVGIRPHFLVVGDGSPIAVRARLASQFRKLGGVSR
jgi:hypothetical protein